MNLTICQNCHKNPATYGDGLTWSRCSECQLKQTPSAPSESGDNHTHYTVKGLTSIILPVYLVNYPLFHYTGNCISSIKSNTAGNYELIIVDNGSPIKPPNMQAWYAEKVIPNDHNEGVTKAWNQGIRCAFGEYIVLLNNDTQVYEGWLDDMKEALEHLDLVMATPMYSNTEPFAREDQAFKIMLKWREKAIWESFSEFKDFSCVGFKKSLVDEIGLFDEDFFSYASDSEFMKRMEQYGKKYASCKRIAIHHVIDATGASIEDTPEIMNRDKAVYERKQSVVKPEGKLAQDAPESPQKTEEVSSTTGREDLIRTNETGDKVYLIKEGKVHWVRTLEALKALGFDLGMEKSISKEEFVKYEKAEPITIENANQFKYV